MFHALSLLVLTGLSWVPTGAIVGFIGRRGFSLFCFQVIGGIIGRPYTEWTPSVPAPQPVEWWSRSFKERQKKIGRIGLITFMREI